MKKISLLLCLLCLLCNTMPITTYADETSQTSTPEETVPTVDYITIWSIKPANFVGDTDIYLCSEQNMIGTHVGIGEEIYFDEEWCLTKHILKDVPENTYWLSLSTGAIASLTGFALPDMEPKSLVADIDYSVNTLECKALEDIPVNGDITIYKKQHMQGYPQFFCFFGTIDDFEKYFYSLESLFDTIMQKTILQRYEKTKRVDLRRSILWMTEYGDIPGHFDDYHRLLRPLGFDIEDYLEITDNLFLQALREDSLLSTNLLSTAFQQDPTTDYAKLVVLEDPAISLREWGWNIYYDVQDPSVIQHDEFGNNIGDFSIHEDISTDNIIIPIYDRTVIPDNLPFWWPVIGMRYPLPTTVDGEEIVGSWVINEDESIEWEEGTNPEDHSYKHEYEEPEPLPQGKEESEIIELLPTVTPVPTEVPPSLSPTPIPEIIEEEEPKTIPTYIYVIGGSFLFILFIIIVLTRKKKESK